MAAPDPYDNAGAGAPRPAGISGREVVSSEDIAAFDRLPKPLRDALNHFPLDMSAQQLEGALARGWTVEALLAKIEEQAARTPISWLDNE